jgi:hypothetical protein
MSKYKEFAHGNAPEESDVDEPTVVGTYLKHLNTYQWIQANPQARRQMRNHPGVKTYKHIHLIMFIGWVLFVLIFANCK